MTSRSALPPEVLPNQCLSAHVRSQSGLDSPPVCSFNNEPPLPGKTMDECSLSNCETSHYFSQPVNKLDDQPCTKLCAVPENPMCRICHEGGLQEELLSPCECLGTMATIHRSCLEHWLSASGTSFCELCNYQFTVQRKSRPLLEWLQNPGLRQEKRTLFGDMVSLRYHCRLYNEWRQANERVVLLLPRSHSEPVLHSLNSSQRVKNLSKESIV
ncbi:E3 ubiquitin-protein ligase MARCHF3 isoform X2 [Boleophthalmus pectinirostris]|uniref:E3 ubiquitin-protein ligase MARCHF3 isoform X2 n=1 Tax=Boleophthalmus pectinirostris TaxID=150288 RepID=UPI0024324983|nr:E3 ubiquitin-protein ligase MARCHF3 isoform X2 [Boleophthalmus pectinirostris]